MMGSPSSVPSPPMGVRLSEYCVGSLQKPGTKYALLVMFSVMGLSLPRISCTTGKAASCCDVIEKQLELSNNVLELPTSHTPCSDTCEHSPRKADFIAAKAVSGSNISVVPESTAWSPLLYTLL